MKKILVVDDDPDVLTLIKILLLRYGFLVELLLETSHLEKTIAQFEPSLIMLDVNLQDADGREICKKLKTDPLTHHIPVILFSSDHKLLYQYKDCNANSFVTKPIDGKHLIEEINRHFLVGRA